MSVNSIRFRSHKLFAINLLLTSCNWKRCYSLLWADDVEVIIRILCSNKINTARYFREEVIPFFSFPYYSKLTMRNWWALLKCINYILLYLLSNKKSTLLLLKCYVIILTTFPPRCCVDQFFCSSSSVSRTLTVMVAMEPFSGSSNSSVCLTSSSQPFFL